MTSFDAPRVKMLRCESQKYGNDVRRLQQ